MSESDDEHARAVEVEMEQMTPQLFQLIQEYVRRQPSGYEYVRRPMVLTYIYPDLNYWRQVGVRNEEDYNQAAYNHMIQILDTRRREQPDLFTEMQQAPGGWYGGEDIEFKRLCDHYCNAWASVETDSYRPSIANTILNIIRQQTAMGGSAPTDFTPAQQSAICNLRASWEQPALAHSTFPGGFGFNYNANNKKKRQRRRSRGSRRSRRSRRQRSRRRRSRGSRRQRSRSRRR